MAKKTSIQVGENIKFDFLIIGSGVAGASAALKLSKLGKVGLLCKETLFECNTRWAQGGIASVLSENDSYESHTQDTLIAGNGLCHEATVRKVVAAGPKAVQELIDMGVAFTPSESQNQYDFEYHLTQEGAHSARRIIHAADMTGAALQKTLVEKVTDNPNIVILEFHTAMDLSVTDKVCFRCLCYKRKRQYYFCFISESNNTCYRWSWKIIFIYYKS